MENIPRHNVGHPRKEKIWKIYIVNLSFSTTGSSSCQCLMTLYGEKTEIQKNVFKILLQLRSAFERGELRSKGHGKKSVHFNGSEENIELLLRTIISANQLSVHGAMADLCKELAKDSESSGKLEAPDHLETMEIPVGLHTNEQQEGNLVQDYERRFEQLSDDQKLSKLCSDAGLRFVERGQYFYTLDTEERGRMQHSCREYTMPRYEKKTRAKGWILKDTRIGPVLDIQVCRHEDRYSIDVLVESVSRPNSLLGSNRERN